MSGHRFWIIAVPKTSVGDVYTDIKQMCCNERDLCFAYKMNIPQLRVGTLDALMSLSDDLFKIDAHAEQVCKRLVAFLASLTNDTDRDLGLMAPGNANLNTYVINFLWDAAKYPAKTPLRSLVSIIKEKCHKIEEGVKQKSTDWASTVQSVAAIERRQGGSLMVRDLDAELVKPKENVVNTEYLETLLVVVPKQQVAAFEKTYEHCCQFVVPRSAKLIASDDESCLYRVILFRRAVSDFRAAAREHRWNVRDYDLGGKDAKSAKESARNLIGDRDKQSKNFKRWCQANFTEAFSCWIHLKAIRIFVESVLRYCLPPNFQAVLIVPHKKTEEKLRTTLNNMFSHLAGAGMAGDGDEDDEFAALSVQAQVHGQFHPYVYTELNLDFQQ